MDRTCTCPRTSGYHDITCPAMTTADWFMESQRLLGALLKEPNNPACQKNAFELLKHFGEHAKMPAPLQQEEQAAHEARVFEERAKIYGEATFCHGNLGLYFTGLIQQHYDITLPHPIPSDLAMMMMIANKMNRMARPRVYHEDNFTDMRVYTGMTERAQRARLEKK